MYWMKMLFLEGDYRMAELFDNPQFYLYKHDNAILKEHVGFTVESVFGKNCTLFNIAKESAVVYKLDGMT